VKRNRTGNWQEDLSHVDISKAVMADGVDVVTLKSLAFGQPAIALSIEGEVLLTNEQVSYQFLLGEDGMVSVLCAVVAGLARVKGVTREMVYDAITQRTEQLRTEGLDV
jgi:hypothetical protein